MKNDGYEYRQRVGGEARGQRLLDFLETRYRHSSRSEWERRIRAGQVRLEGRAASSDESLRPGMTLVWERPGWEEPDAPAESAVLHEDDDLLIVNKPAGLPTMPGAGYLRHTLLHQVRLRDPQASPAHRLGRWTSGAVLCVRSSRAAALLSEQWRRRAIGKRYRALAVGDPPWTEISVRTPIGPVPHPLLGSVHAASSGGKEAESRIAVVQRRGDSFLCDVWIETGRPHQIRIHLASAGHPLAGDPLYRPGGRPAPDATALPGDPGYLLHAAELAFRHPADGRIMVVEAPPPEALRATP